MWRWETTVSPLGWGQCPLLLQRTCPGDDVTQISRASSSLCVHWSLISRHQEGKARKDSHSVSQSCWETYLFQALVPLMQGAAYVWSGLQTKAISWCYHECLTRCVLFPACHLSLACETTIQESKSISTPLGHCLLTFFADYLWSSCDHFFGWSKHQLMAVCLTRNRPALAGPSSMPVGEAQRYRALAWLPGRLHFTKQVPKTWWPGGVIMGRTGAITNI